MAHKHNRRRIRPRHRHAMTETSFSSIEGYPSLPEPINGWPITVSFTRTDSGRATPSLSPRSRSSNKSTDLGAQQWQNRYIAWQKRDRAQRYEANSLEEEQYRLFGGEPGDDETLCYKMLEYFGGLDYIDV